MYERMLNKQEEPTITQMAAHCGACAELFTGLNEWLSSTFGTAQAVTFPYGNRYGWGAAHRKSKKLICKVIVAGAIIVAAFIIANAIEAAGANIGSQIASALGAL